MSRIAVLDKLGWPIHSIKGRPILSALRLVIHGRAIISRREWERRKASSGLSGNAAALRATEEVQSRDRATTEGGG